MRVLNLTQHPKTVDQSLNGVMDVSEDDRVYLKELLTFGDIPTSLELVQRAEQITSFAMRMQDKMGEFDAVMIGGAPFFMPDLFNALDRKFRVYFAFSKRESVESRDSTGAVVKTAKFVHRGFVAPTLRILQ